MIGYLACMPRSIASLADLLHPVDEAAFFAEYYDRKPLHVSAADPDRFADVMSWDILNRLLNMTAIWSPESLKLVLDRRPVPAERYCRTAVDRTNKPALQPDAEQVNALLQRGASLVINDIDTLWPGLAAAADALESGLNGKTQSNLYCSAAAHQAFDSHFDTHEVFALHIAGEKVWRIYEGRLDRPIAHPAYKTLPQSHNDKHKGSVAMEVTLRPGDLLYIPRGTYHDALASSAATIHVSFGVTHMIGFDVLNALLDHAVDDPLFRTNLPLPRAGEAAVREHLQALADRARAILRGEALAEDVLGQRRAFRYWRGGYDLPHVAPGERFKVLVDDLSVTCEGGLHVLTSGPHRATIPPGVAAAIAWIVERTDFIATELSVAFPDLSAAQRARLLADLAGMRVIGPA